MPDSYLSVYDIEKTRWPEPKYNRDGVITAPKNTPENFAYMLDHYGISVKYNIIKKAVEIAIPGATQTLDNRDNVQNTLLRGISHRNGFPVSEMEGYVKVISDRNAYNHIAMWIDSHAWDGIDRITQLVATIGTPKPAICDMLIRKWLTMSVEAIYQPNFVAHGCLTMQGGQDVGKTTWVKKLLPVELSEEYIRTGMSIDPDDKDSVVKAVSAWIVELGELGSTMRRDPDKLKAFITQGTDRVRRPYDRLETEYKRRTVFYASVNEASFLRDDTGSRRWWVIPCESIDYMHTIDMSQLWAQVKDGWIKGDTGWLSKEQRALLNESNDDHQEHDPIHERIVDCLRWDSSMDTWVRMSSAALLMAIGIKDPTRPQATRAGMVLGKLGVVPKKSNGVRYYTVPLLKSQPIPVNNENTPDWL